MLRRVVHSKNMWAESHLLWSEFCGVLFYRSTPYDGFPTGNPESNVSVPAPNSRSHLQSMYYDDVCKCG
jgi:hypothetical protein